MTFWDLYKDQYGKSPEEGVCPYQCGYEKYAVPITTNGCIHKRIRCSTCWCRIAPPYKIGDVVHAVDDYFEGDGIIIEIGFSYLKQVLVVFSQEGDSHLHNAISSINVNHYGENRFRFFGLDGIQLIPEGKIEDVMPREEFMSLLRLGYK